MKAFIFPGQGTQHVGMGRQWFNRPASRPVFEDASRILGYDVTERCFRGPAAELTTTQYAQPAIFTCNAAALAAARDAGLEPDMAAGHSVGEFSALLAAEAVDFEPALLAVQKRAELMGSVTTKGTMAAVVGLGLDDVRALCGKAAPADELGVGLHNAPEFVVVSGTVPAVEECSRLALDAGAIKVVPLAVSHAFHSPLMLGIRDQWADYVATLEIRLPQFPVVLNSTGRLAADVEQIRVAMVDQLTDPVLWVDCVLAMRECGMTTAIEVGDSKALTTLNRNIDRSLEGWTLLEPGSLDRVARTLAARETEGGLQRVVR